MVGKEKFNILIVPPTTGETIQLNLPQYLVSLVISVLVVGLLFFSFLLWQYFQNQDATAQLQALRAENAFLESRISGINTSLSTLGQHLGEIEQTEENIRLVFGFPEVDPAERALGIGGFPPADADSLNPRRQLSYDTEADLAHLMRRTRFERENYDELLDSLIARRDQLDHTPSILPARGYFSSGFGMRRHPNTGIRSMHRGADFAAATGTSIIAPANGKIVNIAYSRDLGKTLVVDHGYGIKTLFGHLSQTEVEVGQQVTRGQVLGQIGNTGLSTGPHLHYEVHLRGRAVNPLNFIYDFPTKNSPRP